MSKRLFTKGQISALLRNKDVTAASERSITYRPGFKLRAVKLYREGLPASEMFLTGPRDAAPDMLGELCQELPQSLAVAHVVELATREFAFHPTAGLHICQSPLFLHGCSSPCFATHSEVLTLRPNHLSQLARTAETVLFVGN